MSVIPETIECVVLEHDLPESGLRKGDLGTVVQTYDSEGIEVEFLNAAGKTLAVLTLTPRDVRKVTSDDIVASRPATSA